MTVTTELAIPVPGLNVQVLTTTLAPTTPLVVYMSAGGGIGPLPDDAEDYDHDDDDSDTDELNEIAQRNTSHDVGVQQGRQHLIDNNGLDEVGFVNPFEYEGPFGHGEEKGTGPFFSPLICTSSRASFAGCRAPLDSPLEAWCSTS